MEIYLNILIILALFLIIFGGAEFLYKKGVSSNITRKIVHIGGGIVSALFPLFVDLKIVIVLGVVFTLILLISKRNKLLGSIHKIEDYSVGALLFPFSTALTAIIFWPINTLIFQGSVLVLGLSDGIAEIIGKKYGKKTYSITGTKTMAGSAAFLATTFLILLGVLYIGGGLTFGSIIFLFTGSLLLTAVEAFFGRGWDNLFIPLASGFVLYFIL